MVRKQSVGRMGGVSLTGSFIRMVLFAAHPRWRRPRRVDVKFSKCTYIFGCSGLMLVCGFLLLDILFLIFFSFDSLRFE